MERAAHYAAIREQTRPGRIEFAIAPEFVTDRATLERIQANVASRAPVSREQAVAHVTELVSQRVTDEEMTREEIPADVRSAILNSRNDAGNRAHPAPEHAEETLKTHVGDHIDRRSNELIGQILAQRMTIEEEIEPWVQTAQFLEVRLAAQPRDAAVHTIVPTGSLVSDPAFNQIIAIEKEAREQTQLMRAAAHQPSNAPLREVETDNPLPHDDSATVASRKRSGSFDDNELTSQKKLFTQPWEGLSSEPDTQPQTQAGHFDSRLDHQSRSQELSRDGI